MEHFLLVRLLSYYYHFESKITIQIYDVGWNLKGTLEPAKEMLYKVGMWSSHNSKLNDKSAIYLYFIT